jgi:putative membrane-bound dehydrogenase-like protein
MHRMRSLSLGVWLVLAAAAPAQVAPEQALSTFTVSNPALEISLWASEPLLANPTCMDVDHRGRVWVCESVNYRHRLHHQPPRRPAGDRILILEDTTGAGRADKVTTFYQSKDTLAPLGIAVAKDPTGPGWKVFVCQSPDILVFEDRNGDGHADGPPRKLLSGFGGIDHDHGVHGILIGPDGKLYFSVGDQGVRGLVDRHGKKCTTNGTDCRAGTIWRCDLDGKNLELIAQNFRNEYEPCVDSFGTVFVSDNDDDGSQQTRICYVMPGGNYGYWPRGPGESHWHEEQPGVVPKILRTYFGSPTGMCVYEGTLLPESYRGQLLHTDAGPRHVRCYHLTPEGAGYAVDREDLVTSTDPWFRPSDACVGPDGSVYVADWYDPGVGGHGIGDFTRGRVYRIAPKGNRPAVPPVNLESTAGLTAALASPALSVRFMAMARLGRLEREKSLEVLVPAATQKENAWLRARALWQLGRLHHGSPRANALLTEALHDPDPRFRTLAVRIFRDYDDRPFALTNDPSPAVRREILLGLREADPARARPVILNLARRYDGTDRFYLEALGIAVGHEPDRRRVILADFEREFPAWNEPTAGLIWELHPPGVRPTLAKRLADPHLPAAQLTRVVDILAGAAQVEDGRVLLHSLPDLTSKDARERALEYLQRELPRRWRDLSRDPELPAVIARLIGQRDTRPDALALIRATQRTEDIPQVAAIAGDASEPPGVRSLAIQTLGALPAEGAVTALAGLLSTDSATLRADAVQALGHLNTAAARKALQDVVLAADRDPDLRRGAVAGLAGSRQGSAWLLDAHAAGRLPESLRSETARLLRNSPYQDLRIRAAAAFPPPGRIDPKRLPSIASLLPRRGDLSGGKALLAASARNDLQCLKCHSIRGVGGNVGPDLSVIGKKASRENLFESILFPSKAIADQYLTWVIETKAGLSLTGLLVGETPDQLTLRDANGKDTVIPKKDVEARAKSPNSLMPSDLLGYMTEDDLVDVVEYLISLKAPALTVDYWHILGPFDNGDGDAGMERPFAPEKVIDLKGQYPGKSGTVAWRTVKPDEKGYVDLQAFLAGESDNVVSYLYREVESPAEQEALVLLGTDDCAKLWVNGRLVYTNMRHRAAAPEEDAVRVPLKRGRNAFLLKINNGDGAHGFFLTLQAEQDLKPLARK